jgi:hypothetical protein
MKIIQDLMIILKADEGKVITDGQGNYGHTVYLGIYDSPSNWYEINEEEVPPDELVTKNNISD